MIIKVHLIGKLDDERRMNQGVVAPELAGAISKLISRPVRSDLPNFERARLLVLSKIEQGSFPQHQAVFYLRWPLFILLDRAVHAMTWYDRLVTCSLQSPSFDRGYALAQQRLRVNPFETIVALTLGSKKVRFYGYLAFKIRSASLCTAYP
jgi:hypothetical protein